MPAVLLDNNTLPLGSLIVSVNTEFIIATDFDLQSGTLQMPCNCTLAFDGGSIRNGIIEGSNTRIKNPRNQVIFYNIELTDSGAKWRGDCRDTWFDYNASTQAHWAIVKSVCQFASCLFSPRRYYIERWETIMLPTQSCVIDGGGATFIITGNKGNLSLSGQEYETQCLFLKESSGHCFFCVSNLSVLDNRTITPDSVWGEDFSSGHVEAYYSVFKGSGSFNIFRHVKYDGGGYLWEDKNDQFAVQCITFDGCEIRTPLYAIRYQTEKQNNPNASGSCDMFCVKNSYFYMYAASSLVGPLRIVATDDGPPHAVTKHLVIENSRFESEKEANLEISGCEYVDIRNNAFLSVQCSDSHGTKKVNGMDVEMLVNIRMDITGNTFGKSSFLKQAGRGLHVCGGDILFSHNLVYIEYIEIPPGAQRTDPRYNTGAFTISGYQSVDCCAIISQNTFVFKGTDLNMFKTMLVCHDTVVDLIGNRFSFLDVLRSGDEIALAGFKKFFHNELEDDPRFTHVGGGDFKAWRKIDPGKQATNGALIIGQTQDLSAAESFLSSVVEFDVQAYIDVGGLSACTDFFSFNAGSYEDASRSVRFQCDHGCFRAVIDLDDDVSIDETVYSSNAGVRVALPGLGFAPNGTDLGFIRVVLVNEKILVGNTSEDRTRVLLFINDYQVDTFLFDQDVLGEGIGDFILHGSSYLRIKQFRLRDYGRIVLHPVVAANLTID